MGEESHLATKRGELPVHLSAASEAARGATVAMTEAPRLMQPGREVLTVLLPALGWLATERVMSAD